MFYIDQNLYSCLSYNEHDMQHIKGEIRSHIACANCPEVYRFTMSDVKVAVHRLKPHKAMVVLVVYLLTS